MQIVATAAMSTKSNLFPPSATSHDLLLVAAFA
jgi:hypothetical protein